MSTILMVELSKYIIPLKFEKNKVLSVDYLPRFVDAPKDVREGFARLGCSSSRKWIVDT